MSRRITSEEVIERLAQLFLERGTPVWLRSDNGPEFVAKAMWEGLLRLVGQLMAAYRIPISRVVGHRERPSGRAQAKTCLGFGVAVIRDLLRQKE